MTNRSHPHWHRALKHLAVAAFVGALCTPAPVEAAAKDAALLLRPHCAQDGGADTSSFGPVPDVDASLDIPGEGQCPRFRTEDPQTQKTPLLEVGDTLDIDIVIENPSTQSINHARTWLSYDPNILEGQTVEIARNFPLPTPGEADFDAANGYVMIEASSDAPSANRDATVAVARVVFSVVKTTPSGTFLSFYDVQPGGHTTVTTDAAGSDEDLLGRTPGTLHVLFTPPPSPQKDDDPSGAEGESGTDATWAGTLPDGASCSSSTECASGTCEGGICLPDLESQREQSRRARQRLAQRTAFSLLQVQNVRTTSEGSSLYLAWDALNSSALKAYNIYYGTTSGRYIHRKTVEKNMTSVALGSLPLSTRYFLALRAVSASDEESAFSQEVAVTVGDPASSTAPLALGTMRAHPVQTRVSGAVAVPGQTGASSTIALLLLLSAGVGTALASRRQLIVSSKHPPA